MPHSTWAKRLQAHLLAFPDLGHLGLDLAAMGAPADWLVRW